MARPGYALRWNPIQKAPNTSIGPAVKLAYRWLVERANSRWMVQVTAQELGAGCGASDRAARKWIAAMKTAELIEEHPGPRAGVFLFHIPQPKEVRRIVAQ